MNKRARAEAVSWLSAFTMIAIMVHVFATIGRGPDFILQALLTVLATFLTMRAMGYRR